MTTFQEHFMRLQEIHLSLSQHTLDIDQAILLQKEAQEHVSICKAILHGYQTDIVALNSKDTPDISGQNVTSS